MNAFFDTVLPSDQTKLEDVREEMYDSRGDSIGGAGEIAGGVNRRLFARSARGNIFSEDGDTKGITRNLPYEGALDKIHLVYATLLERFHALSKIPPAIMGVNAGKGESAQAREDLMLGIQSELATDRVKCSKILKDAIRAASGMPMKDLNVDWLKLPYENTPQYSARIREEFKLGLRGIEETRKMLGMPELEKGELEKLEKAKKEMDMGPGGTEGVNNGGMGRDSRNRGGQ